MFIIIIVSLIHTMKVANMIRGGKSNGHGIYWHIRSIALAPLWHLTYTLRLFVGGIL